MYKGDASIYFFHRTFSGLFARLSNPFEEQSDDIYQEAYLYYVFEGFQSSDLRTFIDQYEAKISLNCMSKLLERYSRNKIDDSSYNYKLSALLRLTYKKLILAIK